MPNCICGARGIDLNGHECVPMLKRELEAMAANATSLVVIAKALKVDEQPNYDRHTVVSAVLRLILERDSLLERNRNLREVVDSLYRQDRIPQNRGTLTLPLWAKDLLCSIVWMCPRCGARPGDGHSPECEAGV